MSTLDELADDVSSGAWRWTDPAETAQLDALAAASVIREVQPVEPRDAMVADARGSVPRWPPAPDDRYVSGFIESDRVPEDVLDRELNSAPPLGVSIPVITGASSRSDRATIAVAIRHADSHPAARWYVMKKLLALDLGSLLPCWPELVGLTFHRDGRSWRANPLSPGETRCESLGITASAVPTSRTDKTVHWPRDPRRPVERRERRQPPPWLRDDR